VSAAAADDDAAKRASEASLREAIASLGARFTDGTLTTSLKVN